MSLKLQHVGDQNESAQMNSQKENRKSQQRKQKARQDEEEPLHIDT